MEYEAQEEQENEEPSSDKIDYIKLLEQELNFTRTDLLGKEEI